MDAVCKKGSVLPDNFLIFPHSYSYKHWILLNLLLCVLKKKNKSQDTKVTWKTSGGTRIQLQIFLMRVCCTSKLLVNHLLVNTFSVILVAIYYLFFFLAFKIVYPLIDRFI